MTWIKRNLFFVIGGALALVLLGAAGFYDYTSWKRNTAAFDKLNEVYDTLRGLTQQKPSPGNATINNVETARQQEAQLRDWIRQARNYFQTIAPIPNPTNGPISDSLFGDALHHTIDQLRHDAVSANVGLPPQYDFSFQVLRDRVKFATGSLGPLAAQLGEVKAISEILYAARVNQLDGIQRLRVSADDTSGPQTDYLNGKTVTSDLAVLTPYTVTFRGFSPEIAKALSGFASSSHGFIVESIIVQPAGAALLEPLPGMEAQPSGPGPGAVPDIRDWEKFSGRTPTTPARAPVPAPGAMPGRGGTQTVLQEQLLRATIVVEIVKLSPRR